MLGSAHNVTSPAGPVVNAILALDPKLDHRCPQAKSTPVRRARDIRNVVVGERLRVRVQRQTKVGGALPDLADKRSVRRDGLALVTAPGAQLAAPVAGCELGVAFLCGRAHDRTLDTNLPPQSVPVKQCGGVWVGNQFQ